MSSNLAFWSWAKTPPMGWNSWDSFATTVTEQQVKAETDYMAANMKRSGWQYIIVDIQWYEPHATGFEYNPNATLAMDSYGRLQPATTKFPSAANGAGFKALADYVHAKGLKFGIHMMRGIPRQAVNQNTPIFGSSVHAADIANKNSTCPWNSDMYGVDMSKPGAQEYYDSLYQMFASWGVDFVKVDDLSRPYHQDEIEAIRKAIDKTGRQIVFSTSPGETPLSSGPHVEAHANMWRVSDDFWDNWGALKAQFHRLDAWTPYRGAGHFPDADMLPLGAIRQVDGSGAPFTHFTPDEQQTMMTLWSIVRSPLMMGGDLAKNDANTLALLTNNEVIAVDQNSTGNQQLFNQDGLIAWTADVPHSHDKYVALFNTRDENTLDVTKALFASPLITRDTPGHGVDIDVNISGAKKLYLLVDDGGDNFDYDHFDWAQPRLIAADGSETKLTDLNWVSATAGWGKATVGMAVDGKPLMIDNRPVVYGIGTHANSLIEYDLPAGCTRFKAFAGLDDGALTASFGGTVHAMVFTTQPYTAQDSADVSVAFNQLGFSGPVRVRDLWQKKDLGVFSDKFVAKLKAHASGLYRVSPIN